MNENNDSGVAIDSTPLLGCAVCDAELRFRWTDTHGVAVCANCGAPHRILHYDGNKRVEKPPECQLLPEWIAVSRRYFAETKRMVDPGGFDMGILGGRKATYSGATREDGEAWDTWLKEHEAELPKPNARLDRPEGPRRHHD